MNLINITPHAISLFGAQGKVKNLLPSGTVARIEMTRHMCDEIAGAPVYMVEAGEIIDLPAPNDGVGYVASAMVAAAAKRPDVFSPGELIRDEHGNVIGAKGLTCYHLAN